MNEEFKTSPLKQLIIVGGIIIGICLLVVMFRVTILPFFMPKPEPLARPKEIHKAPEQNDYKKIIEDSKNEYRSFMEQNKNRLPEQH
ncbi:MAG: hypothetical protein NTU54_08450 [Candidatus Omnitrophica bacterium]|nr:hypothetical protein [Candidatus Omnitrophota bacterium]